jgi:hypothetical protein
MVEINYKRIFLNAARSALLILFSFFIYELLTELEKKWNHQKPNNELYHSQKRHLYKFTIIFISDLIILYLICLIFKVNL